MRDKTGYTKSFKNAIELRKLSHKRRIEKINSGNIKFERLAIIERDMVSNLLYLTITEYSEGLNMENLKKHLTNAVYYTSESWDGFWKLKNSKGKELDQYILSAYDEMLWMLSLSFLLDIDDNDFKKLVEVIDRDKVKDFLFEFIIKAKLPERKPIEKESYKEFFRVPKVFEKLRRAIKTKDKSDAEKLIKEFITKDWYKNHKEAGWYNSHKSKHNTYFGYWSFETAAVAVIMDLDDSSFRNNQYYPKDLADYYRNNRFKT